MSIFIVLPAYNEESCLKSLLDKIAARSAEWRAESRVIVVDDGSADGTAAVASSHPLAAAGRLELIRHDVNRGLAAAVDTGIEAFLDRSSDPADIMVTMDADDTHDPEYVGALVGRIRDGADVAICSRFVAGGAEMGVSAFRKLLSRGAKRFMDTLAPIPGVKDISSGYGAYGRGIVDRASRTFGAHLIQSKSGSVQAELLIRFLALGARVEEVPFTLRYDLKRGPSKIGMSETIRGYFALRGIKKQSESEARLFAQSAALPPPDAEGTVAMICTYNEAENIGPLLRCIRSIVPAITILVVDDNSPDGTGRLVDEIAARDPRVYAIHRAGKLGLGSAIAGGVKWALDHGFRFVINMDADFSHDPVAIPEFIRRGQEADYVIGARYVPGGGTLNWGLHRRLLSRCGNMFARFMLGVGVHDLTTGYRLIRLEHAHKLQLENIDAKGYGFLIIMTFRAAQAGLRIVETPIRFLDRRYGESKMSADIIQEAFRHMFRLRRERLRKERKNR